MTTPVAQPNPTLVVISDHNPIPGTIQRGLAASAQAGRGQIIMQNPSTGYAQLAGDSLPNLVPVGVADYGQELTTVSTVAGGSDVRALGHWLWALGAQPSTAGDPITNADFATPVYAVNENALGKLSHLGYETTLKNRSLAGLSFGYGPFGSAPALPVVWVSPIAWRLAQSAIACDRKPCGSYQFEAATGASTSAVVAERVLSRAGIVHGKIVDVKVTAMAAIAASESDFLTFTLTKYTATAPTTGIVVATGTTKAASMNGLARNVANAIPLVTTNGTEQDLLETDVLTLAVAFTAGTTANYPQCVIDAVEKVG